MPAPLAVDREAVKVLVRAVGPAEAARQMGLPEPTVRQWSSRGQWLAHAHPIAAVTRGVTSPAKESLAVTIPPSMRSQPVTGVTSPSDALANTLAERKDQTRLGLSKWAVESSTHLATLQGEEAAAAHPAALGTAGVAGKVWPEQQATGNVRIDIYAPSMKEARVVELEPGSVEQA